MLGVLVIVFTISYLAPGDPVISILGTSYTPESYAKLQAEMGLDKPFLEQLGRYIWNLVVGLDLGKSFYTKLSISQEIVARFPVTFQIGMWSVLFMLVFGLPLGIYSAIKQYGVLDITMTSAAMFLAAVPNYVLALLGIIFFGVRLKWLPVAGLESVKSWILPVCANSLASVAYVMRMTRTTMLEVIRQDYIRTARAKGQKEGVVIMKHALINCLIPIVTIFGGMISRVLAGSIIVETIFSIPGMGMYMVSAINSRDYPVINTSVLLISLVVCVMNLVVDVAYAYIDPRIKAQYESRNKKTKSIRKMLPENAEVT